MSKGKMPQTRYRLVKKEPDRVNAILWNGTNFELINEFLGEDHGHAQANLDRWTLEGMSFDVVIYTKNQGDLIARKGDYIVKTDEGEYYPVNADQFEKKYEQMERNRGKNKPK